MAVIVNDDAGNELGIGKGRLRHRGGLIARGRACEMRLRTHQAGGGEPPGGGPARRRRSRAPA